MRWRNYSLCYALERMRRFWEGCRLTGSWTLADDFRIGHHPTRTCPRQSRLAPGFEDHPEFISEDFLERSVFLCLVCGELRIMRTQ
jgi:hypothetical protein